MKSFFKDVVGLLKMFNNTALQPHLNKVFAPESF